MRNRPSPQNGFFLIEALVAIAIFSLGILGMVAIGGIAISAQTDARFRTDAASLADELASDIVLNVDRSNLVNFQNSLLAYQHQPTGVDCAFTGPQATDATAQAWLARVSTQGPNLPGLPGATLATQQILIDTSATGFNRVQITICWQGPTDTAMRHHTLVTYVNGLL
jgi:type IV pilus assembly protein PilV